MILQLTTEICVLQIIFVLWNKNWFALQDLCVFADHFCSLEQNLVCFARFVCVADHFCSLQQWVVVMSFLADFCGDGSKP
jgi:hypothetical protein